LRSAPKRPGLALALVLAVGAFAWGADWVYRLNGVAYVFPAAQGSADEILSNDGTGVLSWAEPSMSVGIWTGGIVFSTVACPAGWTRLSAADSRVVRGAASVGGTGGADTHGHTLSGVLGAATPAISGSAAGSVVSIGGSTDATSVSHTHGTSISYTNVGGTPPATGVMTGLTVQSSDPGHSHGAGSLAGSSHGHGVGTLVGTAHGHGLGTLAAASASNLAAYYGLIVCQKD
jgi:hypothetical protein